MYSRKAWGGSVEPFILTKFIKSDTEEEGDPLVGLVIFEWNDEELIGRTTPDGDVSPQGVRMGRNILKRPAAGNDL
jgi:hypothetical protein